jgi:protein-tyrosine-phosphatase
MTKILFVCMANVGRSQMAMTFYNQMTGTTDAESAGTEADVPGETIQERTIRREGKIYVIDVMKDEGVDVSNNIQTQITSEMLDHYDKIISMAGVDHTPAWLSDHPNYTAWDVEDPGGKSREDTAIARDIIKAKVKELVSLT